MRPLGVQVVKTKNTDIAYLREILRARGGGLEGAVLAKVSADARQLYENGLAFQWTPLDLQMEVFVAAAEVLFPGDPEGPFRIGRLLADKAYGGVYKAVLRIPSMSFVVGRGPQVWSSYYDVGEAVVENVHAKGCELVVRGFPDFPDVMRDQLRGHLSVLIERTGQKTYSIEHVATDPAAWRWVMRWQ